MSRTALLAMVAVAALPVGCGDDSQSLPQSQSQAQAQAKAVSPLATPASAAPAPGYKATRSEGIDFARPGYPDFLAEVTGMAGHEPWGRWTDANVAPTARFRFAQPLPDKFTLELRASGLGPNAYQPVKIRVGGIERTVTLGHPPNESYRIAFEGTNGADVIEIIPPKPILPREVTPQSTDTRKLGLGIKSIRILD